MPGAERKAKLPPDLVVAKPAAPLAETLLYPKGAATAVGFRPQDWSYERKAESHLLSVTPIAPPVEAASIPPEPAADTEPPAPTPPPAESVTQEHLAAKQALAEDLAGMIEDMLKTTQFATALTTKTRNWMPKAGEAKALDPPIVDNAITASSLSADLARTRPAPVIRSAAPRRWIDAALVLACVVMVLSAGYFAFAL